MSGSPAVSAVSAQAKTSPREQIAVLAATTDQFDNPAVARSAYDALLNLVRISAREGVVTTTLHLGYRLLKAVRSLGDEAVAMLSGVLAKAASATKGQEAKVEWRPVDGMPAYELFVVSAD